MELAGRRISPESENAAYDFLKNYLTPIHEEVSGSIGEFRDRFTVITETDVDTAAVITEALSMDERPTVGQVLAPACALMLREQNREVGDRFLYSFLGNPQLRGSTMLKIIETYETGKLSLAEFHVFDTKNLLEGLRHSLHAR